MSEKVTIRKRVKDVFPQATIVEIQNGFKLHVDRIVSQQFTDLAGIIEAYRADVEAKRSGTGITLIITAWKLR